MSLHGSALTFSWLPSLSPSPAAGNGVYAMLVECVCHLILTGMLSDFEMSSVCVISRHVMCRAGMVCHCPVVITDVLSCVADVTGRELGRKDVM